MIIRSRDFTLSAPGVTGRLAAWMIFITPRDHLLNVSLCDQADLPPMASRFDFLLSQQFPVGREQAEE
jgi:hypothetical protein